MDARTCGLLNRALQFELSAVQHYLAQSVLARQLRDATLADSLFQEAQAELAHARILMERMIESGVTPSAGALSPPRLGRGPADFSAMNRRLEQQAVLMYQDAVLHARRIRDAGSLALFENLLRDEIAHCARWGDADRSDDRR